MDDSGASPYLLSPYIMVLVGGGGSRAAPLLAARLGAQTGGGFPLLGLAWEPGFLCPIPPNSLTSPLTPHPRPSVEESGALLLAV